MIQFDDVVVCYAPHDRYPVNALDHINLEIEAGEWVFIVGSSGAGKSTLLKLIYGGAQATSGRILVDGRDVTCLSPRAIPLLRRKVGVVFQDFQLLAQKTVWENVAFALQVIGAPQRRLVHDVPRALETVGLMHKADARPHELSGGEQQRVAIARAIVNDPLILLADEPTGNLDPHTSWDVVQVLRRINERGTTVVMVTHDRDVVDAMQSRVVRITDGRVISDEAHGIYHPEDDEPLHYNRIPHSSSPVVGTPNVAAPAHVAPPDIVARPVTTPVVSTPSMVSAPAAIAPVNPAPAIVSPPVDLDSGSANMSVGAGAANAGAAPAGDSDLSEAAPDIEAIEPEAEPLRAATGSSPADMSFAHPTQPANPGPTDTALNTTPPAATTPAATTLDPQASPGTGNGQLHDEPSVQDEPPVTYMDRARRNRAPIGSPENPIVQLDRTSEPKLPARR